VAIVAMSSTLWTRRFWTLKLLPSATVRSRVLSSVIVHGHVRSMPVRSGGQSWMVSAKGLVLLLFNFYPTFSDHSF
jgi:hypothetical protein